MNFLKVLFNALWVFIRQLAMVVVAPIPNSIRQVFGSFGAAFRSMFRVSRSAKNTVLAVVSTVVILASLTSIVLTQWKRPGRNYLNPYIALGQVLGEETAKLVGANGQIVVIAWDTQKNKLPALEGQMKAFKDALKAQGGISVVSTETTNEDPTSPYPALTSERFFEILNKYRSTGAIVSFVGIPHFKDEEIRKWPKNSPKLVVVTGLSPSTGPKKLLQRGVLQVAIVPRYQAGQDVPQNPTTLREWFDKYYQVVTPKTAALLPY